MTVPNNLKNNKIELLVKIILSLLLAIAFYSAYEVATLESKESSMVPSAAMIEIFIFGAMALIFLLIFYNKEKEPAFAYVSTIPFFMMFFWFFYNMLYRNFFGGSWKSGEFFSGLIKLIGVLINSESISLTMLITLIFANFFLWRQLKNKKTLSKELIKKDYPFL